MKHIWLIDQNKSTTLFYRNYSELNIDPDLVSGLLSALNTFSEVELKSQGIKSIEMGGLRWVYYTPDKIAIMLVGAAELKEEAEVMKARLQVIFNMFVEQFKITSELINKPLIQITRFNEFNPTIDMLIDQWRQAESIISGGKAKMYDLLGIFQQIYNQFNYIFKYNFFGSDYNKINIKISNIIDTLNELPEFDEYPELKKISWNQNSWDVINLNPKNLQEDVLKRNLFLLTMHLNNILKENLSKMSRLNAYSKYIYPYLINQYELLNKLDINQSLLNIFLQ